MNYTYDITTDITSAKVSLDRLELDVSSSSISAILTRIELTGNSLIMVFPSELNVEDKNSLDAVILAHSGEPIPEDTTPVLEVDSEGRQTVRRATAKKGWHYSAIIAEIETSKTETYNKDYNGNDLGYVTVKLYDSSDVEITVPANYGNAVKTVVNIKPDYDFEVIEGDIFQHTRPIDDIRLWTLGGIPELGAAGTKVFVNGINLKFMSPDDHIKSDGRSSKFMAKDVPGLPYQGNQFEFILKHPAGVNHQLMILLETYKA